MPNSWEDINLEPRSDKEVANLSNTNIDKVLDVDLFKEDDQAALQTLAGDKAKRPLDLTAH
jgi:hypothetical protein